jgi:glycosyltransferase involved in cell wall biosynthesis
VPRVSVIVPAYNADAHLATALESVLAQTYDDWEVVVADDGSTDRTSAVASAYGDRVRVVRSEVNRGLAQTRNLALAHATGELVALLDADDRWLPGYLARQVAAFDREEARAPGVGIVCCDAELAGPDGPLGETYAQRFGRPQPPVDAAHLLTGNRIFVSALMPRKVVDAVGGFEPSLRSAEDLDLWLRIVERGHRVVYVPETLAVYRVAPGTLSQDTLRMTRSRQAVYRRALARGRLSPPERRQATRALRVERAAELVELIRRDWRRRPLRTAVAVPLAAPTVIGVVARRPGAIRRAFAARSSRSPR